MKLKHAIHFCIIMKNALYKKRIDGISITLKNIKNNRHKRLLLKWLSGHWD